MSGSLPTTVIGSAGLQPQTPASLNAQLIANATALAPGLTVLPAGLIEDLSSTATGAVVVMDQARVDTVNSLTPYAANQWLLLQQGALVGVSLGAASNTSVFVQFTSNTPGYVISQGFIVSDGTYQYTIQNPGVIGGGGASLLLSAVATVAGSWSVAVNTVTQIVSYFPSTITLTVTNPTVGTPGSNSPTEAQYRASVQQAWQVQSQGMVTYLKTALGNVPGVQQRLISVRLPAGSQNWEVICGGGGDPRQIAGAIFASLFGINTLAGSVLTVTGITNANPGVVTTTLLHLFTTGQVITITGVVGMSGINGVPLTITVLTQTTFSIGINTISSGTYTSGGVITPNLRNITATVSNYPDTYSITYVNPPNQAVTMTITWNTPLLGVSAAAVTQLAQPAIAAYVNGLYVGQPMLLFTLQQTFATAIAYLIPASQLTRMVFAVSINGIGVTPATGTGVIAGDPEGYFTTTSTAINVTQG